MAIQVSQLGLTTHHTGELKASVSSLALIVHHSGPLQPIQVSGLSVLVHHTGPLQPIQTGFVGLYVHRSLDIILVAEPLEAEPEALSELTLGWRPDVQTPVEVPELNPYRPTVPDDFDEFQRENQEILREQHNKTQAGDTTFPWEMLTKTQRIALFRLGSIGRFYHEDHGIVLARYVQFRAIDSEAFLQGPAGTWNNTAQVGNPWIVTNDLSKSSADAVVGIITAYEYPADQEFGWLMVNGSPWFPIGSREALGRTQGDTFSWSGNGSLDANHAGRVVARRSVTTVENGLIPGTVRVELEGLSLFDVRTLLDANLAPINESITGILAAIEALEGNDYGVPALQALVNQLQLALNAEVRRAQQAEAGIRNSLSGILTTSEVQILIDQAISGFQSGINSAAAMAQNALTAAQNALTQLAQFGNVLADISSLQSDIAYILNLISDLTSSGGIYLPLVDGGIPPVPMYLPNGEWMYVEILP